MSSMITTEVVNQIRTKYEAFAPYLEARSLGHGGITAVSQATGLSRNTIASGQRMLEEANEGKVVAVVIRKSRGGLKRVGDQDDTLIESLDQLGLRIK